MVSALKLFEKPTLPGGKLQHGDVLAFYGRDIISRIIECATRGPSHVAIVCEYDGAPLIIESTTLCKWPCAIRGVQTDGVQAHHWEDRILEYPGRIERFRLSEHWQLTPAEHSMLKDMLLRYWMGLPYDMRGAILSGTKVLKFVRRWREANLAKQFCSELVAAVLMRLNRMPISDPALYNPAGLIRQLRRCGTYSAPIVIHE